MEHLTDTELIDRANDGDETAMEYLFHRHYQMVYRLAYRWCSIKEDAEDIAQDVFIKLVRKLHTFNKKSSFKTWLYRITINTGKDFIRKKQRKDGVEITLDPESRYHPDKASNPSSADPSLSGARVMKAVNQLSDKLRDAALLVFAEGLSHREAGDILGCREATVSWRIFQARKKLSILLGHKAL